MAKSKELRGADEPDAPPIPDPTPDSIPTPETEEPNGGTGVPSGAVDSFVMDDPTLADSDAPAVRAVNKLIYDALTARASDIHLESLPDRIRLRYRIDGILEDVEPPAGHLRAAVLARLRVMAGLNLAEHRTPQDGRMRLQFSDRAVDVRMSTVPILRGESVALRLLDPGRGHIALEDLGLRPNDLGRLMEIAHRPHGMVLTTGPGGSGKSTSLYALVRRLSTGKEKIFTVEDPVEYDFDDICQVSVNYRAGLTFANLLRSLVRQDPDILLVGEIRDRETADLATHAALTGHLVLSTLHTRDSIAALPRLVDLGVPEYLVAHTIEAVMAQRLVRMICTHCAEEVDFREEDLLALGPAAQEFATGKVGRGCEECRGTGFLGRTGLYELLVMTDTFREAFLKKQSLRQLREIALSEGMEPLRLDGIYKVEAGITTPEEVLRVT